MSLIDIKNLTFCHEGSYDNIFENLNLQIDTDWKTGLTGRNGRGKTTLLGLLSGKHRFKGSITKSVDIDCFPFELSPDQRQAALGGLAEQICPELEEWRLVRELSLLDMPEEKLAQRFDTLSSGEQTKALLAVLFLKENSFLLIDEPTNHLDSAARKIVADYLNSKKGFILVSHDRDFLDNCVDHIISINRAEIELQKGNFSSWHLNKTMRDSFELDENKRLKNDISRLKTAAQQTARWSDKVEKSKIGQHAADRGAIGHKAAKMMKRSKSTEARQLKAAEEKSKLLKNIETAEKLLLSPLSHHAERLVEAESLSVSYDGRAVFENLSFELRRGERVWLRGKNGTGKSSIIKLIMGEDIPHGGHIKTASGLKISYISQTTSHLRGGLSAFARENDIDESLFKAVLRKLDFERVQFEKEMEDYSEGQKKKVLVAKSLCEKAHLYIWDEPLNYIDIMSRIQIEELLSEFKPSFLFVEHDAAFGSMIATKIIDL